MIQELKESKKVCKNCGSEGFVDIGWKIPLIVPCIECNSYNKRKLEKPKKV